MTSPTVRFAYPEHELSVRICALPEVDAAIMAQFEGIYPPGQTLPAAGDGEYRYECEVRARACLRDYAEAMTEDPAAPPGWSAFRAPLTRVELMQAAREARDAAASDER